MSDDDADDGGEREENGGTHGTEPRAEDASLAYDTVFELLADRRRRLVLHHLIDSPGEAVDLDDLIDAVVEVETASGATADASAVADLRRRVTTSLHHEHLPRLADTAVVEYDSRSGAVRYWGDERLESHLSLASGDERP